MTWPSDPAAESQLASLGRLDQPNESSQHLTPDHPQTSPPEIKVGKRSTSLGGKACEVFTMSLGTETIELLPLKTWAQLDTYKWRVRGKLPGTPAGLDVAFDHVKMLGETISPSDSNACAKLEKLFADWLAMERETAELARRKAQAKTAAAPQAGASQQSSMHFQVAVDSEGIVHIRCLQGKEVLATIGLNNPGFMSLVNQGWMRKPHTLKTGALHDWVEIDGVLYSFEKGNNDAAKLEQALNQSYLPPSSFGKGKEIVILANAASSTGFDIQFPAKVGGVLDNRRRPLAEDSLELLQDHERCGVLCRGLVIKLSRPNFIFKQKTPDGGERYLDKCPENLIRVASDDGEEKLIDLSQPVNYLHLSAVDLTAVFNHPVVNRHAKEAPPPVPDARAAQGPDPKPLAPAPSLPPTTSPKTSSPPPAASSPPPKMPAPEPAAPKPIPQAPKPLPNTWLKPVLEAQSIRYDWLTFLVYAKLAAWLGNSREGQLHGDDCWFISLGESKDPADPAFEGVFLTKKGSFGCSRRNCLVRFENDSVSVGAGESSQKAGDVRLLGVGLDASGSVCFIVSDGYRSKFGLPETALTAQLATAKEHGIVLISATEVLQSADPLEVLWTVPAEQSNATDPQALESIRPGSQP